MDEWINKTQHIHAAEHYAALQKKGTDTCFNMNEPQTHYGKWNKADTKKQALYDFTYRVKRTETEAEWWLPGKTEGAWGVTV